MNLDALDPLAQRVLRALYELAQLDCPAHAGVLGRAVGLRAADVARVLLVLDARGLVAADRARLTLVGLAVGARTPALHLEREPWFADVRAKARRLGDSTTPAARQAGSGESG